MAPSREWRPGRVSTRNRGVTSRPPRSCYAPPPMVSPPMLPASLAAGPESRRSSPSIRWRRCRSGSGRSSGASRRSTRSTTWWSCSYLGWDSSTSHRPAGGRTRSPRICFTDPRSHFPLLPWVVMYGAWLISLGLSGPPVSGSIGGSSGPMGSDGCRGTRLQRSGRCDGGTGGPAGSAEATGENVHRASSPAFTRLPTPPLLGPEPRPPSQRAVHRVSGDCLRGDNPPETPLAGPGPLALGSI